MDIEVVKQTAEDSKPERKSRASWKPANIIEIPERFKDKRFVYRCVDKLRAGRVMQKLREGWEIDKEIVAKMRKEGFIPELPASLEDGLPKDGTLQFRELIVLRMPKEMEESRQEYLKSIDPVKRANDKLRENTGGRDYGEIERR